MTEQANEVLGVEGLVDSGAGYQVQLGNQGCGNQAAAAEAAGGAGKDGAAVEYLFHASAEDFKKIPGSPIAYWTTEKLNNVFYSNPSIAEIADPKQGLATGNNDVYLRHWHEVDFLNIKFDCRSQEESKCTPEKWYPCQKGGGFRRWYGNLDFIVNWQYNGNDLKKFKPNSVIRNPQYYFRDGGTWSSLSSGGFSMRYSPKGFIFESKGSICFTQKPENLPKLISLSNTKVIDSCLLALSPTLDYHEGPYGRVPFVDVQETDVFERFNRLVYNAKSDWNTFETSWDFTSNPLIQLHAENPSQTLAENYQAWWDSNQATIAEMQRLEEENNRLFIEAYGLQDELTPDVPLEEITLTVNPMYRYGGNASDAELAARFQSDTVCELISYAIGCMMGRYSLDRPGLVYAHAGNAGFADLVNEGAYRSFAADEDGIIPLTDQEWFADDATHRLVQFVKTVWGEASLSANLAFMAQSLSLHALKPKASESSLDVLRRYLSSQFFKDHCRTYKKRPIYWLFSSGKQKAFECLVYLHRYNESTLARMRTEYVVPLIGKLHSEAENLQRLADNAESTAQANKAKKALADLAKKQQELSAFDDSLKHYADQRITLDLDDGVKVNYAKFGELLADSKAITGL